ncbi:MAG TPA: hypothetical protein VLA19_24435 [Herpetosiphonaceae bacterium]|nr:hypothetical protein [Herpetosiphonaceae bacterium]
MSQHIEVVLDDQGRLVLPESTQRQLGLTAGMTLIVEQETADTTYLRVLSELPRLVDRQGILVVQSHPVADLENSVRSEREQRVLDLLQHIEP